MSDIECPLCGHEHDSGNYPDHVAQSTDNRFQFECESCGLEFEVTIEWEPQFYPDIKGAHLVYWTDPIC